jgi:hypothetical protein
VTRLQAIILFFGIIPVAVTLVVRVVVGVVFFFTGRSLFGRGPNFQGWRPWFSLPGQVPWTRIGDSTIRHARGVGRPAGTREPQFSTLGCDAIPVGKAKWRLLVEFQLLNPSSSRPLVIDDMHARLFETDAHAPPLGMISYYGDVWLKQDNTLLKDKGRRYDLPTGDGYIINLAFEATRIEAAPAYGMYPAPKEAPVTLVFGLLLDYYFNAPSGPERHVIPSDALYVFQGSAENPTFLAVTSRSLPSLRARVAGNKRGEGFIRRLEAHLAAHLQFRAVPLGPEAVGRA